MKPSKKNLTLGFEIKSCRDCGKHDLGRAILDMFSMDPMGGSFLFHFDNDRGVLQLNETLLMSMIRMANQLQEDRPLELFKFERLGEVVTTARRVDHE